MMALELRSTRISDYRAAGTEYGDGASAGTGDEENAWKGPGGGLLSAGNEGRAEAGSLEGSLALNGVGSEGWGADAAVGVMICGRQTIRATVVPPD